MNNKITAMFIVILCWLSINNIAYANVSDMIIMVAPQEIEFHLETSAGNISGYTTSGILEQIPEVPIYMKNASIKNPLETPTEYDSYNKLQPKIIPVIINTGKYKLVLYGSNIPKLAKINVELWWNIGIPRHARYRQFNLIYPNVVWAYEFDVPLVSPTNKQIILTKVSTPSDLIKDITIAGQLGYIGNAHFVSDTIEKINEIEKERTKPAEKDDDHKLTPAQKAKKEYTELLGEITEKYNKPEGDEFVKQEAYTVLREDLEYIIGHL